MLVTSIPFQLKHTGAAASGRSAVCSVPPRCREASRTRPRSSWSSSKNASVRCGWGERDRG